MAAFVVAHGAWSAGWAWKKMRPLLRQAGHEIYTPTYTGLGEREHLADPRVNLSTHVTDVVNVLEFEGLRDVILIGHSYGGMVATGVADRAPERIARLVYLDAFVPTDGQSLFDLVGPHAAARMRDACQHGDGWRISPMDMPPDTSSEDRAWAVPLRRPQPIATLSEPLRLRTPMSVPTTYIYCTRVSPEDTFGRFASTAKDKGWTYAEIDASHNPHITAPDALCSLLIAIAAT